jgi:hypothetical protein
MNVFSSLLITLTILLLPLFGGGSRRQPAEKSLPPSMKTVHVVPEILVDSLPAEIRESSGLLFWQGLVWTLNDSGGENMLYGFDLKRKKIVRRIVVEGAENRDWESLAMDKKYIYIGDFGNNAGWRHDLRVYRIPKKMKWSQGRATVPAEVIAFHYPQQHSFLRLPLATRWDCEAFLALDDSLYVFTKDWKWEETRLYILPKVPGEIPARLVDSFFVKGLVTGATLSPDRKTLVLSGYESFYPYLWVFYDFPGHDFFRGKVIRVRYPEYFMAQTEGVAFLDDDTILVSSETNRLPGRIYTFSLKKILEAGK